MIGKAVIREINRRKGKRTIAALADELELPYATVRDFVKGRHAHVGKEANQRMADLLGVPAGRVRSPRATMQVHPGTRLRLAGYKRNKRESFNTVIVRLLDFADQFKKEA